MDTTQSTGNNLTQTLNLQQMQQNIDAMQAQKVPNDQVQSYVDNYQKGADGNYTLKTSQAPVSNQPSTPGFVSKTASDEENGVSNFMNEAGKTGPSVSSNPVVAAGENALGATASGVGTVFAPVTNAVKAASDAFANSGAGKAVEQNPVMGKILDLFGGASGKLNDFATAHPEAARDLSNLLTVGTTALGGEEGTVDKPVSELPGVDAVKTGAKAVGEGIKTAAEVSGQVIDAVKDKVEDKATTLPQRIQTMIDTAEPAKAKELSQNLQDYFNQARGATKGNDATPYEIAGKTQIQKALQTLKNPDLSNPGLLDTAGQTMQSELGNASDAHVPTESAEQLLNDKMKNTLGAVHTSAFNLSDFENPGEAVKSLTGNPSGDIFDAPGRTSKITTPSDRALINDTYDAMNRIKAGNDSPQQVADEISNLNRKVADAQGTGVKPIKSPVMSVVSQFTHELENSLNETAGEGYTAAKETYAKLRPLYDELSQKVGKNFKNAASMMKSAVTSPTSGVRELFQKVQDATGVNLFDHANMAKFTMDAARDTRAGSLLENTANGAKTLSKLSDLKLNQPLQILDYLKSKLENPEGTAIRALTKKGSSAK